MEVEPAGEKTGGSISGPGETGPFGFEVGSTGEGEEAAGERTGELGDLVSRVGNADPFGFKVGATVVDVGSTGEEMRVLGDSVGVPASGLGDVDSLGVVIGTALGVFN